jgi:hypothetical protein
MLNANISVLKKLPPPVAKMAKRLLVYPRYWHCKSAAHAAFTQHGADYRHSILFIAGMPKSGTTWLEKMMSSYPGYEELLMPGANFYELKTGEGHLYDLPDNAFSKLQDCLVLTKMHCHGSTQNVKVLTGAEIPYVILYRDPRDVAVSHYYYVRNTPWHGDYEALKDCNVQEGIRYFIHKRLPEFAHWMRSWRDNRKPEHSLMISYEEMLRDTADVLRRVFQLFALEADEQRIEHIVSMNSFKSLEASDQGKTAFFRKGQAGDWVNHFDDALKVEFNTVDSKILVEFGYEKNDQW